MESTATCRTHWPHLPCIQTCLSSLYLFKHFYEILFQFLQQNQSITPKFKIQNMGRPLCMCATCFMEPCLNTDSTTFVYAAPNLDLLFARFLRLGLLHLCCSCGFDQVIYIVLTPHLLSLRLLSSCQWIDVNCDHDFPNFFVCLDNLARF